MNSQLQEIWNKLEANKAEAISILQANYQKQPAQGWNPKQTVEHILQSEAGVLAYLYKKTQAGAQELPGSDQDSSDRAKMLNERLLSDDRYKQPDILPDPTGQRELAAYLEYWESTRAKWRAFLDQLPDEYMDKQVFKHPLVGRLDMEGTLSFLANHIEHHYRQLRGEE